MTEINQDIERGICIWRHQKENTLYLNGTEDIVIIYTDCGNRLGDDYPYILHNGPCPFCGKKVESADSEKNEPVMGKTNSDDAAFPFVLSPGNEWNQEGLTKREYFAVAAMQGICANPDLPLISAKKIAEESVEQADELLNALS